MTPAAKTRVLVVDDSAIVRKVLSDVLSAQPDIEVVGTAPDPYIARDKILALRPDVLTLDIEMPRMDGLTFLDRLMAARPMPVIVISSLTQSCTRSALEAIHRGAVDVLAKPGGPYSVGELREQLPARVRAAALARVRRAAPAQPAAPEPLRPGPTQPGESHSRPQGDDVALLARPAMTETGPWRQDRIVAIGASTGGTQAIEQILRRLPAGFPPMVIAQHIPPVFSAAFAERLNNCCAVRVHEARDGDPLRSGHALVAPGNRHMCIVRAGAGGNAVRLHDGPKLHFQRPAVDELFHSAAEAAPGRLLGILLTGMGKDGAEGLLALRKAGCATIAQDEASCVVFGMPREAIQIGAAQRVLPLQEIAPQIIAALRATNTPPT